MLITYTGIVLFIAVEKEKIQTSVFYCNLGQPVEVAKWEKKE